MKAKARTAKVKPLDEECEDDLITRHLPVAPTTTVQEDITTAGQRRINLIWENTQAMIAMSVSGVTMAAGLMLVIAEVFFDKKDLQIPTILSVAFGTVIGFYFARTNHAAIGGEGKKPSQKYIGR